MGWATTHIERLKKGETIAFRPHGQSMTGKINSGDLCTVEPIGDRHPTVGEIVLCSVNGNQYLHLIKGVRGAQFLIGNNRGGTNGWTSKAQIFGRCVSVAP
jgi:phage repressor protein C with HTH and peptisase S24 domain